MNRIYVVGNKRGELVEVKIYELERGLNALFLKYFPGLQHPAPNGKYDRVTVTYNFVFGIGLIDD